VRVRATQDTTEDALSSNWIPRMRMMLRERGSGTHRTISARQYNVNAK